jgi:DNA-binding response OmpR family regulator
MTAHAMVGDRQACLDAGMDEYIQKPFDPSELFSKISDVMSGAESRTLVTEPQPSRNGFRMEPKSTDS